MCVLRLQKKRHVCNSRRRCKSGNRLDPKDRVVSVNGKNLCVTQDMRVGRRNVSVRSRQFAALAGDNIDLFYKYEAKLTDLRIEFVGYY